MPLFWGLGRSIWGTTPCDEMTHSSVSQFRSEFDGFLYAPVDEGDSGTFLSVLSALARLDVDPWQEAASLARMSRENATQRLASLIGALPGGLLAHLDSRTIAARLIALLPRAPSFTAVARGASPQAGAVTNSRAIVYVVIINLIFMAFAFGSQYFMADHQSPAQVGHSHVPAASTPAPKVPPPSFGK
jgi:hypothetical protein